MNSIDFQNGFIAGMATKGLIRSGELYKPVIRNDPGVYSYFYIDFKRVVSLFSLGMFNESIIIYDSERIDVTDILLVSSGIYKVYCDLSEKNRGITVINKKTSLLSFATGETIPVFSTIFYVEGLEQIVRVAYAYETTDIVNKHFSIAAENADVSFNQYFQKTIQDSMTIPDLGMSTSEAVDVSYWGN